MTIDEAKNILANTDQGPYFCIREEGHTTLDGKFTKEEVEAVLFLMSEGVFYSWHNLDHRAKK